MHATPRSAATNRPAAALVQLHQTRHCGAVRIASKSGVGSGGGEFDACTDHWGQAGGCCLLNLVCVSGPRHDVRNTHGFAAAVKIRLLLPIAPVVMTVRGADGLTVAARLLHGAIWFQTAESYNIERDMVVLLVLQQIAKAVD